MDLDQYKEKTPKAPTIASLFNSNRFAEYKDKVIGLTRACNVSVKTIEIIREMENCSDTQAAGICSLHYAGETSLESRK